MSNPTDIEAFDRPPTASGDTLRRLRNAISFGTTLMANIEATEAQLSELKQALHKLRTETLPGIMAEAQSTNFDHAGYQVTLSEIVSGSIPKDEAKKKTALETLKEMEGGRDLIKIGIAAAFGTGQSAEALKLAEFCKEEGYTFGMTETVNAQTLQKFARECIKKGVPIDAEALGLFHGKIAKFTKLETE